LRNPQRKSPCFSVRLAVVPDLLGAETFAGIKAKAERITPSGVKVAQLIDAAPMP
jgi:hypothetical protein